GAGAGLLAKLTGLGGGGGAAAGGAASGGSLLGGSVATVTATKVCAVVCSVAVTATGAVEVQQQIHSSARPAHPSVQRSDPLPPLAERAPEAVFKPARQVPDVVGRAAAVKKVEPAATAPPAPPAASDTAATGDQSKPADAPATAPNGGVQAPVDLAGDVPSPTAAGPKAAGTGNQTAPTAALAVPHAADTSPQAGAATGGPPTGGR
ncbi:MAG: hypothetical protein DLM61_22435, partial [Pseudonocardiales bacterium]